MLGGEGHERIGAFLNLFHVTPVLVDKYEIPQRVREARTTIDASRQRDGLVSGRDRSIRITAKPGTQRLEALPAHASVMASVASGFDRMRGRFVVRKALLCQLESEVEIAAGPLRRPRGVIALQAFVAVFAGCAQRENLIAECISANDLARR